MPAVVVPTDGTHAFASADAPRISGERDRPIPLPIIAASDEKQYPSRGDDGLLVFARSTSAG